jgi:hypothetical protein
MVDRAQVIAGETFVGRVPAHKCKSCAATFVRPDTEQDFVETLNRVAKGLESEHDNGFEIRRESTEPKRTLWSTLFGRGDGAIDVLQKPRGGTQ